MGLILRSLHRLIACELQPISIQLGPISNPRIAECSSTFLAVRTHKRVAVGTEVWRFVAIRARSPRVASRNLVTGFFIGDVTGGVRSYGFCEFHES
jgi:hypothetical protein